MVEGKDTTQLDILLMSDTHEAWDNLEKFKKLSEKEGNSAYDYVFLSGDQANLKNKPGEPIDVAANKLGEESNARFLSELEPFASASETSKLFYIPGNHDSECFFSDEPPVQGTKSQNIHKQVVELQPDLLLVGFGGCGPTIWLPDGETEWKQASWEFYPYATEEAFIADLKALWSEKVEPRLAANPNT